MQISEETPPTIMNNNNIEAISGFKKLMLVVKYESLKHIRKKRLILTIGLALGLLILMNIVFSFIMAEIFSSMDLGISFEFPPADPVEFFTGGFGVLSNIFLTMIILAIFFGADSISTEFEHRTGLLLFPNPIKKETIIFGKFIAAMLMCIIVLFVHYIGSLGFFFYIYTWRYSWTVFALLIPLTASFGVAILVCAGLIATTFMLSAIINKGMTTGIVVFFLFQMVLSIVVQVFSMGATAGGTNFETWFIINYIVGLVSAIVDYPPQRITEQSFMGQTSYTIVPDILVSVITIIVGYIIIPLIVSIYISKRREI